MEKKNLLCLAAWTFTCQFVLYAGSGRGQPHPTASEMGLRAASPPQPTSSVVSKWLVTVMSGSGHHSSPCVRRRAGGEMLHAHPAAW